MADEERRTLTGGRQIYPEHSNPRPDGSGMQNDYVVLSDEERAKGFVRPLRDSYFHDKCGSMTVINSREIVETYARNPFFYSGTYCGTCGKHFPVGEDGQFTWEDGTKVGT